jgi:hypothetical protein
MSHRPVRVAVTTAAALALALSTAATAVPARAIASPMDLAAHPAERSPQVTVAYPHLELPGGEWAKVYSDGLAEIRRTNAAGTGVELEHLPLFNPDGATSPVGDGTRQLPAVGDIISDLVHGQSAPYAAQEVVVIYRAGVTVPARFTTPAAALRQQGSAVPSYTSDATLNRTLAGLGVDDASRLFGGQTRNRIIAMHAAAQRAVGHAILDFTRAYALHLTNASVATAVERLRASGAVEYAAPNWTVTTTHTPAVPVARAALQRAVGEARGMQTALAAKRAKSSGVPDNYALTSSAQALLNRPGVDAVPAYSQIAKLGQLPGQGETITNVSLGTLDDASAAANPNDPCNFYATAYGPTTEIINGQRYIDWPSMPLIPTYTASDDGVLDPTGETCGDDPTLTEVGLDFSMMAPLPHELQRPRHDGSGLTDLLGIAPGANFRLVLPSTPGGAVTDVDAAFLAAALQTPRPNIITASLSFGYDSDGFSSRYLEDDPMTEAIIASIVHGEHIVVTASADDGLRTTTNAAVSPAGGSVATETAPNGAPISDLDDIGFSDAVSRDHDSGAIDVGGSTLDDIFAAPPQDPRNKALQYIHAFPATRYDGARNYSSGFGSRVNVSAPGDNVLSFSHTQGGDAEAVTVVDEGGTSASAPETAATAAVVQQVARLTGDHRFATNPLADRAFLEQTGTPPPPVEQADRPITVGPQIDVGRAVSTLLDDAGRPAAPSAPRVAVEQRQQASALGGTISTVTDPNNISLTGRLGYAWITMSPDWVGLPGNSVAYRLSATTGPAKRLATTPWARLQPAQILAAAGLSLGADQTQTVPLVYKAFHGGKAIIAKRFSLTFGPTDGTTPSVLAPTVPPVVTGSTIRVHYDISNLAGANSPTLVVSQPGHVDPSTGLYFRPSYTAPLSQPTGVVDVPVSALQGGGIYGIGIQEAPGGWFETNLSAYAFTRVAPAGADQPAPPTLSADGSRPGHSLEIPYQGSFQLHYDVRNVTGITGAMAEFSAPGPTTFNNYETFTNPSGTQRDDNGHDTGSVAFIPLPSTHGVVTLNGSDLGLVPTMNHLVRVLPMRGGAAAGEASGVSSISMDGVRPADGGSLAGGFGVDHGGDDAFLTSGQSTADGGSLGSVETFRQSDAAITSTVVSSGDSYSTVTEGCSGMAAGDVGLYDDYNPTAGADTFDVLDPVANGTLSGTWTPPRNVANSLICLADNQDTPSSALLSGFGGSQPTLRVNTTDIARNTFSKPVSLVPALQGMTFPTTGGFAQNTQTGTAVVATNDAADPSLPMRVVLANVKTGEVDGFTGATIGFPSGVGVDSETNQAVIGSSEGFGVYDLGSQSGSLVQPGGSGYAHPTADSTNNVFLLQEVAPPTFFGEDPDNNATSSVIVTDETGNVLQRIAGFNFYNIFLSNDGDYLQANPHTRTAFTLGPGGQQLRPFSY